jgi:methionine-S-sulfoxide reductase
LWLKQNIKIMKKAEIYLAGGCFWGTEHYLKLINGVTETEVGYANGCTKNPSYEEVCRDDTGHAETVKVVYDADILPLSKLLQIFFKAINPTSVNYQGMDIGTQYRTGIFFVDAEDEPIIKAAISELATHYDEPIATEVKHLDNFYTAEEYHQDYLDKNPGGYCHVPIHLFEYAKMANGEKKD